MTLRPENLAVQVEDGPGAVGSRHAEGDVRLCGVRIDEGIPPHVAGTKCRAADGLPVALGVFYVRDGIALLGALCKKAKRLVSYSS